MALTRPTIQNINTNLTTFTDSLTVTNFGNIANRDIGEVFDRSQGGGSNVASFWQESTNSFAFAYTSSSGTEPGNLVVTSYADLIVKDVTAGNVIAGNLIVANVVYQNAEYVTSTETVAGNSTVNGLTVNTSATIGTSLGIGGNLTATNILPSANVTYDLGSPTQRFKSLYLSGNTIYMDGTTISSNATSIVFTNPAGGSFTVSGTQSIVASTAAETSQYVTEPTQPNITSVGTLTSLTVSGSITGNTIAAANFGNNGANFTGAIFNAAGSFYGPISGTLGEGGANTALVTTLTSTGNTTVSALTVNGAATVGSTLGVTGNVVAGNISTTELLATLVTGSFSGTATISSGSISGLSGGTGSYTTVGSQTLRVSSGGMAIGGDSYLVNSLGIGQHLYVAGNSNVSGNTVISDIAKLNIPGGTAGYTIKTDGSGNLYWDADISGGITFTTGLTPPVSGNLAGDQWYNTATDAVYEYIYDGLNYYWVDVSGAAFGNSSGTGDALSPFLLMGA